MRVKFFGGKLQQPRSREFLGEPRFVAIFLVVQIFYSAGFVFRCSWVVDLGVLSDFPFLDNESGIKNLQLPNVIIVVVELRGLLLS